MLNKSEENSFTAWTKAILQAKTALVKENGIVSLPDIFPTKKQEGIASVPIVAVNDGKKSDASKPEAFDNNRFLSDCCKLKGFF